MEKNNPQYQLMEVKTLAQVGNAHSTRTALEGGAALGFDFRAMLAVVQGLSRQDFFKSMTTYANHKVWQDVYHPTTQAGKLYVKLTVIDNLLIVSFKDLENL